VPDKDTATTMGKTPAGYFCSINVDGLFTDPAAADPDKKFQITNEIYYRVDPSDSGMHLYVEVISRLAGQTAK
jgi:hypothetical protein